jgi:hypothetical protein
MQDNTVSQFVKGGEIVTKETRRGIEFHAFNWQRQRMLHIGTLRGQVYEKQAQILQKPEPSFAVTQTELGAILETGAEFIRVVLPGKSATYSISVQDFQKHKEAYHNPGYGPQWRVGLKHWAHVTKIGKRNAAIDNPVREQVRPIIQQISLFK